MPWLSSITRLRRRAFALRSSNHLYDPKAYWNSRQDPNAPDGKSADRVSFDVNYIKKHLGQASPVFELGPGVGRTFEAYERGTEIVTLDLSRIYSQRLSRVAQECGLSLRQHYLDDGMQRFPFDDDQFDIGVSCQVFLHQPPDLFAHSLSEFARICRNAVIISGIKPRTGSSSHVFSHDYLEKTGNLRRLASNVTIKNSIIYLYMHRDNKGILQP